MRIDRLVWIHTSAQGLIAAKRQSHMHEIAREVVVVSLEAVLVLLEVLLVQLEVVLVPLEIMLETLR